ncbi:hypothetical protein D9757_014533 [Collybiopsis confluens]|uniref:Ribonuclease H1 N-terminal domain-containing protein n=1 Tax=Collybiopsis confluens TaxID=2823264 RepID=A0A8H5CLW4_9AGAR|nr:hypothetical protein D9757_014533 [Collybiopsis confluens]
MFLAFLPTFRSGVCPFSMVASLPTSNFQSSAISRLSPAFAVPFSVSTLTKMTNFNATTSASLSEQQIESILDLIQTRMQGMTIGPAFPPASIIDSSGTLSLSDEQIVQIVDRMMARIHEMHVGNDSSSEYIGSSEPVVAPSNSSNSATPAIVPNAVSSPAGPSSIPSQAADVPQSNSEEVYYVVTVGRAVGVFSNTAFAQSLVLGVSGGSYRKYSTPAAAQAAYEAAIVAKIVCIVA